MNSKKPIMFFQKQISKESRLNKFDKAYDEATQCTGDLLKQSEKKLQGKIAFEKYYGDLYSEDGRK